MPGSLASVGFPGQEGSQQHEPLIALTCCCSQNVSPTDSPPDARLADVIVARGTPTIVASLISRAFRASAPACVRPFPAVTSVMDAGTGTGMIMKPIANLHGGGGQLYFSP